MLLQEVDRIIALLNDNSKKPRIIIIGDIMLDKYYYGEVQRISPEAPVPINRIVKEVNTLGGAANVAHNLALNNCEVLVAGLIGDDQKW